ncbi:hypothetical protein BH11BAC4_BH11BAC4_15300 [soil metagenome]
MAQFSSATNFFIRQFKKLSLEIILLLLLFIACCWGLLLVADMIFEDRNLQFDEHIFASIAPHINESNTKIISFITFFGSQNFLLPAYLVLISIFLFYLKKRRDSFMIVAVSITSTAVLFLLKSLLQRQRPLVPLISRAHGYSFPSGHTFSSIVFCGILAYIVYKSVQNSLLKWTLIISLFSFAFLIGFSRVYLKLHYASDVIAGWCLGIIWLILAKWILNKMEQTKGLPGLLYQPDRS